MRPFKAIFNSLNAIIVIPIAIVIMILVIPIAVVIIITTQIDRIKDKRKLKDLIIENNGKIYFIYSDYNNYDFTSYFEREFSDVVCVKVKEKWNNNLLINHLTKDCGSQNYPRLTRIINDEVLVKLHFGSFKNLYKRKNDIESFYELLEKSIKNLKNENENTRKTLRNRER